MARSAGSIGLKLIGVIGDKAFGYILDASFDDWNKGHGRPQF